LVSINLRNAARPIARDDEFAEHVAELIDLRVRIHIRIELLQRRKRAVHHGLDQARIDELAVFIERDHLPEPARVVAESRVDAERYRMDEFVDDVGVEVAAVEQPQLRRSCDVAGRLISACRSSRVSSL
jgi:hypothetical protein